MKQTAVEWLYKEFTKTNYLTEDEFYMKFEQAKAMEKEQIKDAWNTRAKIDGVLTFTDNRTAEQYYNKTFKSENIVMFMTPENGEIESIILTDNPDCGVKGITFKSE